jgi:ATP-binding cassette subfamily B multidrug efflux pump
MFKLHVSLTWAALSTLPLLIYMFFGFQSRLLEAERAVRNTSSDMNTQLQESISGVRITQAFAQEERNQEKFREVNESHFRAGVRTVNMYALFWPGVELFWVFSTIVVMGFGGYWLTRGEITVGTIAAFLSYTGNFFGPIRNLSQFLRVIQTAAAGAEKIFLVMDTKADVVEAVDARELPLITGRVQFDDVHFAYEKDLVLCGVNLLVEPGQTIAVVGHTGAGKTSLINLVCGFYRPTKGAVRIDGHDLRDVTFESLRRQVGLVLQEPFLFSGTVRENMLYGKEDANDDQIWQALGTVGAARFVQDLSAGLDTELGERGAQLSMGQRQLLSFARALLADPRLLILDEATANIDTETESRIQKALEKLLQGRTAFVIAHRLSTIRRADQIIVVEEGRIVESGTHHELMEREGIYHRMTLSQKMA